MASLLLSPVFAFAQDKVAVPSDASAGIGTKIWNNLNMSARTAEYDPGTSPEQILTSRVAAILNVVMGLLGTAAVILMIYAGFLWTTAGGNDDQVGDAKKIIKQTAVGMLVIILAYAIVNFVFSAFLGLQSASEEGSIQQSSTSASDIKNNFPAAD